MTVHSLPSRENPIRAAALQYAEMGLSVLPWVSGAKGKVPTRKYDASAVSPMTLEEIRDWWELNPRHNVGIITGPTQRGFHVGPSDIVGIDIDSPAAAAYAAEHFPSTMWRTQSGRLEGGSHLAFLYPDDLPEGSYIKSNANICGIQGFDIRGKNGFLAMPPSLHASGRNYQWLSRPLSIDDLPMFDPAWLIGYDCLGYFQRTIEDAPEASAPAHMVQAAAKWLSTIPPAIEGCSGDAHTFFVACALRRGFSLDMAQARAIIQPWNAMCQPPWDDDLMNYKLTKARDEGTEPMGGRYVGGIAELVSSLDSPVPAAPAARPPAPTTVADVTAAAVRKVTVAMADLTAARAWAHALPAEVTADITKLYTDDAINFAAVLKRRDLGAFAKLKQELKMLRVEIKEWEKRLNARGSATQRLHQLAAEMAAETRVKVHVGGDELQTCKDILAVLAAAPTIYQYGSELAHISSEGIRVLKGDALHNAILQIVAPIKSVADKEGDFLEIPTPLPTQIVKLLSNLLPEQLAAFRPVRRLVRFPFCVKDPNVERPHLCTEPGYDPYSQTLLVSCPEIDMTDCPTIEEAVADLTWIWSDFPWAGPAEFQNYLSVLVQLCTRGLIDGPVPFLFVEANVKAAGKTKLAEGLLTMAGESKMTTWPTKHEELAKCLLPAVRTGRPLFVWDNATDKINSPDFNALLTAREFEARTLRTSNMESYPMEMSQVVTGNNATLGGETARRAIRARLLLKPGQRKFKIGNITRFWQQERARVWTAVCRLVQNWIDKGMPATPALERPESYENWADVVGNIMHAAGFTAWMGNVEEARLTMSDDADWDDFFMAWQTKFAGKNLTVLDLYSLALQHNLLAEVLGDGSDKSQQTKLGIALHGRRESFCGAFQLVVVKKAGTGALYRLQEHGQVVPLTRAESSVTLSDVRG